MATTVIEVVDLYQNFIFYIFLLFMCMLCSVYLNPFIQYQFQLSGSEEFLQMLFIGGLTDIEK